MKRKNLFHYNSKILKVSQLAAIEVYDFIGKKDEISADRAAVESMREELNKVDFNWCFWYKVDTNLLRYVVVVGVVEHLSHSVLILTPLFRK